MEPAIFYFSFSKGSYRFKNWVNTLIEEFSLPIPIVYLFDAYYANPTIVSAISAIQNNECDLEFHLVFPEADQAAGDSVKKELATHGATALTYPFSRDQLPIIDFGKMNKLQKITSGRIKLSDTVCMKTKICEIIPRDRFIYIDGDTLVGNCLKDLYNFDLGDQPIGAVEDYSATRFKSILQKAGFGLDNYFNTGMMLMQADQLREINFFDQVMAADKRLGDNKLYSDQDSINVAAKSQIKSLPKRFNIQAIWFEEKAICDAQYRGLDNSIVHFIGGVKPWQSWHRPNGVALWRKYARLAKTVQIELEPIETLDQLSIYAKALDAEERFRGASRIKSKIINELVKRKTP